MADQKCERDTVEHEMGRDTFFVEHDGTGVVLKQNGLVRKMTEEEEKRLPDAREPNAHAESAERKIAEQMLHIHNLEQWILRLEGKSFEQGERPVLLSEQRKRFERGD